MVVCEICGEKFYNNRILTNHLKNKHNITTKDYVKIYVYNENVKCPYCENDRKYYKFKYYKTCGSSECISKSRVNTNMNKYGHDNPMKNSYIKDKVKQTNLDKYGVENYTKTDDYKAKFKETCLNKYGEEHHMKSDDFKLKYKSKIKDKYGVEYYFKTDEFKNKYKDTSMNKYGVDHPMKSNDIVNKHKNTCIERYGVDCYTKTDDYKDKSKITSLNKYGVEYYSQTDEAKLRNKITCMIKYNADTFLASEYNTQYNLTEDGKSHIKKVNLNKFIENVLNKRSDLEFITQTSIKYFKQYICLWKCKQCDKIFEDHASATNSWLHPRCPMCNPYKYSSIENKVYNYIRHNGVKEYNIIRCTKQIITPYELDLYIPNIHLGIECDGNYWHSDDFLMHKYGFTNKEYCELKNRLCKDKGIKLLRFTEDEINNDFDKVKRTIDKYIRRR